MTEPQVNSPGTQPGQPQNESISEDNKQKNAHGGNRKPTGFEKTNTAKKNNRRSKLPKTPQEADLIGIGAQFWD